MTTSLMKRIALGDAVFEANQRGHGGAGNWLEQETTWWDAFFNGFAKLIGVSMESVEQDHLELESACRTLTAVQLLTSSFFTESRELTERDADVYQLSVESIFLVSQLDLPSSLLAPSFESSSTYSVEAEKKAGDVLRRIWAWIKEQMVKVVNHISELIGRFKQSSEAGTQRVEGIRKRLLALENKSDVSTEASTPTTVSVPDLNLIGEGGSKTISVLSSTQANTKAAGNETLVMLRKTMDVFKGFKPGEHDSKAGAADILAKLTTALELKKGEGGYVRDLPIGPGNSVRIQLTQGQGDRVGAKVSSHQEPKKSGMAPAMTSKECVQLLDALAASYGSFDSMKAPMDSASRVFKSMGAAMDSGFNENMKKLSNNDDIEEKRIASQASQMYAMFGTILAQLARLPRENLSAYMLTQYAIEKYLDRCVDALESKKAA